MQAPMPDFDLLTLLQQFTVETDRYVDAVSSTHRLHRTDLSALAFMVQAARAAVRTKGSYFGSQYRRLVTRRGDKRAILAVAHSLVIVIYHMLERGTAYSDLGADYFVQRQPEATAKRLARQIEQLGYTVTLTTANPAA